MTLLELANQFDLTEEELRVFQHVGLLRSFTGMQSDEYNDRDVLRVSLLMKGEELGFSIYELKEVIGATKLRTAAK